MVISSALLGLGTAPGVGVASTDGLPGRSQPASSPSTRLSASTPVSSLEASSVKPSREACCVKRPIVERFSWMACNVRVIAASIYGDLAGRVTGAAARSPGQYRRLWLSCQRGRGLVYWAIRRIWGGNTGIHHITLVCARCGAHAGFYTGVLGLRLVKQTVNFDQPDHLASLLRRRGGHAGHAGHVLRVAASRAAAARHRRHAPFRADHRDDQRPVEVEALADRPGRGGERAL